MTENPYSWETLEPERFYDELGHGEWERLERDPYHRLEWDGTVESLERHLPERGHVLDVGGAAGRYSVWLADRGYDVTLVDISETQLDIAREKCTERGLDERVTIERGDVRNLAFDADAFDATLCLGGPISHVLDEEERHTAVAELERVTRSSAPVFVSVMGRLAMIQAIVQETGTVPAEEDDVELLPKFADCGTYDRDLLEAVDRDPTCFAAHFFRAAELEALLEENGLAVEHLVGLEGIASVRRTESGLEDVTPGALEAIERTVQLLRDDRTVADLSTHMLAVGRVE
ncbi:class I SAM-dependent methyltransferase [Natronoglomus mannanivorans]|uniref:Class I SAM-dependent methyltransferase n=1 Tax=Natronoglomus mannanivorans TaxID=2979990 RepID=A0AAP2YW31_9EURY|nr:class I SAM-dependent methyltransferase [Halobacteria archaeon AArc-xg1-1]